MSSPKSNERQITNNLQRQKVNNYFSKQFQSNKFI